MICYDGRGLRGGSRDSIVQSGSGQNGRRGRADRRAWPCRLWAQGRVGSATGGSDLGTRGRRAKTGAGAGTGRQADCAPNRPEDADNPGLAGRIEHFRAARRTCPACGKADLRGNRILAGAAYSRTRSRSRGLKPMHHFVYRNGVMHAEAVDLVKLADAVGTPFYCYSTATLERHYRVFAGAFADVPALVCYAMKANSNQAVIKTLAALGAGADVVSEVELKRARAAGIAPDKIMFSGIGKTARELALAVDEGILCVNVESEGELALLSSIAAGKDRIANVSVRVNPDVDAKTHHKIATGKSEDRKS